MQDFAQFPEAKYSAKTDAERALRSIVEYQLYVDLQRGWRVTMPNLEQTGLLTVSYRDLAEIAARVTPGKHCALLVDQAGWHVSDRLVVPANITIVPLPAKCPELNPVENVWQFMRGNWLSNRIFRSYDAIVDHCCDAWNRLADQPWRVMSLGLRNWVPGHRP